MSEHSVTVDASPAGGGMMTSEVRAMQPDQPQVVAEPHDKFMDRLMLVLLGIVFVVSCFWYAADYQKKQAAKAAAAVVPAVAASRLQAKHGGAPAPKMKKGPKYRSKGTLVSSWLASGAGDSSYNGAYVESGTWLGDPAYVNDNGRWLYKAASTWFLGTAKANVPPDPPTGAVYSNGATLPGSWVTCGAGVAPAPTVAEYTAPVTDWTYDDWFDDAPYVVIPPLRPCRATIGAVDYIILPSDATSGGFLMFRLSDHTWHLSDNSAILPANQYDDGQTGGVFSAADGSNVWLIGGSYLDSSTPKLIVRKFAIVEDAAATLVSGQTLTLASLGISNFLETSAGNWRFLMYGADDSLSLCAYAAGDGSYTTVYTWPAASTALDSGWADVPVALSGAGQIDHAFAKSDAGVYYWMRHVYNGTAHKVIPYTVTEDTLTELADDLSLTGYSAGETVLQTWANYTALSRMVGEVGTGGATVTPVDPQGLYWVPGNDGSTRAPFATDPAMRRWLVDGGASLYCMGWLYDSLGYFAFAEEVAPIALSTDYATTYASRLRITKAFGSSYGFEEVAATSISADWATTYATRLAVSQAYATTYPTRLALSKSWASSYGTDITSVPSTPKPVTYELSELRVRRGV